MNRILATCFLFISSATCFAQADRVTVAQAQKTFKNRLMSDSPAVKSVKFDGCRVSIKSGGSSFWAPSQGSVEASRTGYFTDTPSLSSGPDRLVRSYPSDHYTIDFSILDTAKVSVGPTHRKDRSRISVVDEPAGAVTAKSRDKDLRKFAGNNHFIVVRSKNAEKMRQAIGDLAAACAK